MKKSTNQNLSEPISPRNPAEAALMNRIQRYFLVAFRSLSRQEQTQALSASNDFWTILNMLALAPIADSPELKVRLRGALARRELLESDGGVLSPSSVAKLLGVSRQSVGQRRSANKLLAVEGPRGYLYPYWQFDGSEPLAGMPEVLELLANEDPWTRFIFFLSENDASHGKRPLDLLRKKDLAPVLRAARVQGQQGTV
ncbi:MAG: hypothetical protein OXJ38_02855 [Gammaproteobacteria bacterium]|nr:hypothetical protein [Gammaproteobacteria bacterium]MDE0611418.1 hypothetical protein [Gammaproteobacteria bacterium]